MEFPRGTEEEYIKWAEEELKKTIDREVENQSFIDMFTKGTTMIHVDEAGNQRVIEPYSDEYWKILKKSKGTEDGKERGTK